MLYIRSCLTDSNVFTRLYQGILPEAVALCLQASADSDCGTRHALRPCICIWRDMQQHMDRAARAA